MVAFYSPDDDEEDSDAYIKPVKKTKHTAQATVTEFFEKKPAGAAKPGPKATAARKASGSTKPAPKKAAPKAAESSDDEILMGEPESVPVAPRAAAPRRAAAKTAYIELSDDDDDD
jgi:DNA topoisomerase-2